MAQSPRVLLVTSRFFLLGEIMTAFRRMGVEYGYLDTGGDEIDSEEYLRPLLKGIERLRPHFLLTVNHLGVDHEGLLTGLLSRLDIPLASWFVDNPALGLALYSRPAATKTAMFTWDADNMAPLRQMGFEHVFHLPLAADERRFAPPAELQTGSPWRSAVSFVGNSMVIKTGLRLDHAQPSRRLRAAMPRLAQAFGEHPEGSVRAFIRERFPALLPDFEALETPDRQLSYETAVIWESTRQYRARCLGKLMEFGPTIVGDEGWLTTFGKEGAQPGGRWRRLAELSYYDDLPGFYPLSDINFNCTSLQMKGAVNQRVFDVPACGGFLLSDYRAQIENLFEPGKEVALYGDPDEIPDLVRHFLAHPTERARIAQAARKRVLAQHTYVTRMGQLLRTVNETFGLNYCEPAGA